MMFVNDSSCLLVKPIRSAPSRRKGALLLELIVSVGMLIAILLAVSKMSVAQSRLQHAHEQEVVATHQLQNLMETYLAKNWNAIKSDLPHELTLPESAQEYFPDHAIDIVVAEQSNDQGSEQDKELLEKRVTIRLSWKNHQGTTQRIKSLTAWAYGQSEEYE